MFEKLQSDVVDDLYFEGGRDRRAFRKLLSSGAVPAALLARVVDLSVATPDGAAAATAVWRDVLRSAFEDVGTFEFSATDAAAMTTLLTPLAALTSHPPLLRLLASMLLQEVVEANGAKAQGQAVQYVPRAWAKQSLLAPLLGVTTYVDPDRVRRNFGGTLDGGLPPVLAEVPGYPRNRCVSAHAARMVPLPPLLLNHSLTHCAQPYCVTQFTQPAPRTQCAQLAATDATKP